MATRSAIWILLVSLASPAAAQDTDHFGQLGDVIKPGVDIRVTLSDGGRSRARVIGLTPETLTVRMNDQRFDLARADVRAVHYGVDDSTVDGFWRGLAGGTAVFATLVYSICSTTRDCAPDPRFAFVGALYGAAGGVIGVAVDHAHQTEARWPETPGQNWSVAPLLTPRRQGVAVSLSF